METTNINRVSKANIVYYFFLEMKKSLRTGQRQKPVSGAENKRAASKPSVNSFPGFSQEERLLIALKG